MSAAVHLLQITAQLCGASWRIVRVECAPLFRRASKRVDQQDVNAATICEVSTPRSLPDRSSVHLHVAVVAAGIAGGPQTVGTVRQHLD